MQRVLLIGSGGAGKSTLATQLGAITGLPVIHLDALYWRSGWVAARDDEWRAIIDDIATRDAWIMDGNYGGTMDRRIAMCDTVVFLDLPRLVCLTRIITRWLRYRGRSRPDMAAGCPEQMSLEFLRWVWTYPRDRRPGIVERLAIARAQGKQVVVLCTSREVSAFVSHVQRERHC